MATFTAKYDIKELITLVTDPYHYTRIILEIAFSDASTPTYKIALGDTSSWHYEFELRHPETNGNGTAGFKVEDRRLTNQ